MVDEAPLAERYIHFTATEHRILDVLQDGKPHRCDEFLPCLEDQFAELHTIRVHISRIRDKMRGSGETILCAVVRGKYMYVQVKLLNPCITI